MARQSEFKAEYSEQARKLYLLGARDEDVAKFLGVSEKTLYTWQKQFSELLVATREGKMAADANVAQGLYQRAIGYRHRTSKPIAVSDGWGKDRTTHVEVVEYEEAFPPDGPSCSLWLRNRRPDLWRDKQEFTAEVKVSGEIATKAATLAELLSPEQLAEIAEKLSQLK